jgi:hypothetical protein
MKLRCKSADIGSLSSIRASVIQASSKGTGEREISRESELHLTASSLFCSDALQLTKECVEFMASNVWKRPLLVR